MAIEIVDLPTMADADLADDDWVMVYDISAGSQPTKKVSRAGVVDDCVKEGGDHSVNALEVAELTATVVALTFDAGSSLTDMLAASLTVTHSDILTTATEIVDVSMPGVTTADFLSFSFTGPLATGLVCQGYISAADTVSFKFWNPTGSTITGASYTARATVMVIS